MPLLSIERVECGHRVQTFGDLTHAEGVVLCTQCRDAAGLEKPQ